MGNDAGNIIVLNGASSSGKSTLAAGLQARLEEPFWHYSIDHLNAAKVLPVERIRSGEFKWADVRQDFFLGFHRSIPAFASSGNNLIVEHIVESEDWMRRLRELLAGFDVFFVGIHCPLEVLQQREIERGDRRIGEAQQDFETTHSLCTYDFEVSSTDPNESNVEAVVNAWKSRSGPTAFER